MSAARPRIYDQRHFDGGPLLTAALKREPYREIYDHECPHCGAPPFQPCRDPRGYIAGGPHSRRGRLAV